MNIKGAGADAPLATDGKQSDIGSRYDLLPPAALSEVARVLNSGAEKYGEWSFTKIAVKQHINHAMMHTVAYLAGDETEKDGDVREHLVHACTRLMFAIHMVYVKAPLK